MQIRNFTAVALAVLAGLSGAAQAADVDIPVSDWTGWSIGLGGGYGMANHTLDLDAGLSGLPGGVLTRARAAPSAIEAAMTFTGIGGQGAFGTIQGGYDFATTGGWLFGVQGDLTLSGMQTELTAQGLGASLNYTLQNTSALSVLARAGHVVNDATLVYLVGGWTHSRFEGSSDGLAGPGLLDEEIGYSYSSDGFTIGGGVENVIADNITFRLEHRLTFNRAENVFDISDSFVGTDFDATLDDLTKIQTIRAVLSYRPGVKAAMLDGSEEQWNGLHIGAGAGYGMMNHVLDADLMIASARFSGVGAEGYLGTIEVGYDRLLGERLVAGILAGYTYSNVATEIDATLSGVPAPTDTISFDYSLTPTHNLDVLGRVGLLTGPDVLWYGLAGYTRTWFNGDLSVSGSGLPLPGGSYSDSYDYAANGLTLGAGVEVMLCDNVSWRTEYRFTNYVSEDIIDGLLEASSNAQSVRSVVSWHF